MEEGEKKLYWKIVIDTRDGVIQARKFVGLWKKQKSQNFYTVVKRGVFDLEWDIVRPNGHSGHIDDFVSVQANDICFTGGYLRILDPGLRTHAEELEIDIDAAINNVDASGTCFYGQNIRLEVDFASEGSLGRYPLVYYDQCDANDDSLGQIILEEEILKEKADRDDMSIHIAGAAISNINYRHRPNTETANRLFNTNPPTRATLGEFVTTCNDPRLTYQLKDVTGVHTLAFFEDADQRHKKDGTTYFEMELDTMRLLPIMPFSEENETGNGDGDTKIEHLVRHRFGLGKRDFYVGFNPDDDVIFKGRIQRVMLDPALRCRTCVY